MGTITKSNTFAANTVIESAKVNTNFDEIIAVINGSISAANLASNAVTTAKITDANVTAAKLATDSVETAKIKDDAVTTDKILDDAVTTDKILDDAVTTAKILDNNITTAKILDDNVTEAKLAIPKNSILVVADQKVANTAGGTFTSGDWRTRDLNTVRHNTISGASLASNQITLPAGTYYIYAEAQASKVKHHQIKLYDVTNSVDLVIGRNTYIAEDGDVSDGDSSLIATFLLSGESALEIRHICSHSRSNDGFGRASNFGVVEVYTQVYIAQIA